MVGDLMLRPWDTMSLRTADLGVVCVRARAPGLTQTPQQSHPLSPLHEPLHWRAKRDPKAQMISLQSSLREGRVVGPSWEKLKPKGPKGRKREVFAHVGQNQNLKDLKDEELERTLQHLSSFLLWRDGKRQGKSQRGKRGRCGRG